MAVLEVCGHPVLGPSCVLGAWALVVHLCMLLPPPLGCGFGGVSCSRRGGLWAARLSKDLQFHIRHSTFATYEANIDVDEQKHRWRCNAHAFHKAIRCAKSPVSWCIASKIGDNVFTTSLAPKLISQLVDTLQSTTIPHFEDKDELSI